MMMMGFVNYFKHVLIYNSYYHEVGSLSSHVASVAHVTKPAISLFFIRFHSEV